MKQSIPLMVLALGITSCDREEHAGQRAQELQASIKALKTAATSAAAAMPVPKRGPDLLNVAEGTCDQDQIQFDTGTGKKVTVEADADKNAGFKVASNEISWDCGELAAPHKLACAATTNYVVIRQEPGKDRFEALCYRFY